MSRLAGSGVVCGGEDGFRGDEVEVASAGVLVDGDAVGTCSSGAAGDEVVEVTEYVGGGDGAVGDRVRMSPTPSNAVSRRSTKT